MAKELSRDEFYFVDFVPAGFSYDAYNAGQSNPAFIDNYAKYHLENNPKITRMDFARELGKAGGFLVGWGKRRALMKLITLVDMNAYVIQGIGFTDEQDATAFILKWS